MFPLVYRHNTYWGAPAAGFYFDSPMCFGPRPMHHMHCGNPFMSFMGGFAGGLAISSAFGWGGNSYVSYPSTPVSVFPSAYPAYPVYQSYNSFGYDSSSYALKEAITRFVNSFPMSRNMATQTPMPASNWTMPTYNWSTPAQTLHGSTPIPTSHGTTPVPTAASPQPFSSLTQSARSSHGYSIIPPRVNSQTPVPAQAQAVNAQPQNNAPVSVNDTPIVRNNAGNSVDNSAQVNQVQQSESTVVNQDNRNNVDNTPPKTAEQIKADEDAFNAVCKGGDCGDNNHRVYYNPQKKEWVESTKKGYPKQPVAPKSMLAQIPEQYAWRSLGDKVYLQPEALKHFIEMSDYAFAKNGLPITVLSPYRDEPYQQKVLDQEGPNVAAPPGYSEHHTGFAMDINLNGQREKSREYKWLVANAKKFGFERSYPDRIEETQHWRFNPELCEKYKKEREELLQKYVQQETPPVASEAVNSTNTETASGELTEEDKVNISKAAKKAEVILSRPVPSNLGEIDEELYSLNSVQSELEKGVSAGTTSKEVLDKVESRITQIEKLWDKKSSENFRKRHR